MQSKIVSKGKLYITGLRYLATVNPATCHYQSRMIWQ